MVDAPYAPVEPEQAARERPWLGYAIVWGAVALFSVNATVAKVVLESADLSALRLAEVRATGSALLLFAALALFRRRALRISRGELPRVIAFGVFGLALAQFFFLVGIQRLNVGIALVLNYLAPVFVALWVRFVVREPVRRRIWVAIALALAGLSLVVDLWSGITLDGLGLAACVATALAYAAYVLLAERSLRSGRDAASLMAWGFLFAAIWWAVVQPWWTFPAERIAGDVSLLGRLADVEAPVWLLIAYVTTLGSIVSFSMLVVALHYLPATRVTIIAMLEPVGAGLVAFAWLGEELTAVQLAGAALVLTGIVLAQTARTPKP